MAGGSAKGFSVKPKVSFFFGVRCWEESDLREVNDWQEGKAKTEEMRRQLLKSQQDHSCDAGFAVTILDLRLDGKETARAVFFAFCGGDRS